MIDTLIKLRVGALKHLTLANVLMVVLICVSSSVKADEKLYYYIFSTDVKSEEARLCDNYIRDNYSGFIVQVKDIGAKFTERSIQDLITVTEDAKFKTYMEQLRICSLIFRYTGDINYIREAYSDIYFLLTYVDIAKETGRYKDETVKSLEEGVIRNIKGILESKRIEKMKNWKIETELKQG